MARKPVEKTIDGHAYTFCNLDPWTSIDLLTDLFKIIGAPLSVAMEGSSKIENIMDKEVNLSKIVTTLCEKLNKEEVRNIIKRLLEQTMVDNKRLLDVFSCHFSGRIEHLFKVVYAALEVEYAGFFAGNTVLQGFLKRAVGSTQEEQI